ncbi:MAG TPA: hypothetical protein VKA26_00375 [Ignavibacteriaceae bacterium]|nr:hypothetical protein [Ignavibacteriaceae bacterium]
MKRIISVSIIPIIMISFITADLYAQQFRVSKNTIGWGAGSKYNKMYNENTVVFISGKVVCLENISPINGMTCCQHILVKIGNDTVSVHLGPVGFMESQAIRITLNDSLTIEGSLIIFDSNPVIIAASLKNGNETLLLRDDKGYPLWCRQEKD